MLFSILRICLDVFQKTSCVSLFTIQETFKFYKVDIQMPFTTALFKKNFKFISGPAIHFIFLISFVLRYVIHGLSLGLITMFSWIF